MEIQPIKRKEYSLGALSNNKFELNYYLLISIEMSLIKRNEI